MFQIDGNTEAAVTGVHHVSLTARDLDATTACHESLVGLEVVMDDGSQLSIFHEGG